MIDPMDYGLVKISILEVLIDLHEEMTHFFTREVINYPLLAI